MVPTFAVEHDDQRKGASGSVTRRPCNGVAHLAAPRSRSEGSGFRAASTGEAERRSVDGARTVDAVQLLLTGQDTARDELKPDRTSCQHHGHTAGTEGQDAPSRPPP